VPRKSAVSDTRALFKQPKLIPKMFLPSFLPSKKKKKNIQIKSKKKKKICFHFLKNKKKILGKKFQKSKRKDRKVSTGTGNEWLGLL